MFDISFMNIWLYEMKTIVKFHELDIAYSECELTDFFPFSNHNQMLAENKFSECEEINVEAQISF